MSKDPWYHDGLRFACTQCGNCCGGDPGYVWATKEEVRRIAEHLGRPDGWLDDLHLRRIGLRYSLTEKRNGDCIFLRRAGGKATCSIYPVRPAQCRTWPFWNSNLKTPQAWREAGETCPGIDRGRHYELVQIEVQRGKGRW